LRRAEAHARTAQDTIAVLEHLLRDRESRVAQLVAEVARLRAAGDGAAAAALRAVEVRCALDLAARDRDLRVLRTQLRTVRGTLHAVGGDGYLDADACATLLDTLDQIARDER
jgi:hypothetical protein